MFGYIGPSGRVIVAKLAENMNGYLLALVSKKIMKKVDRLNKKRGKDKPPTVDFCRVNGAQSELARGPLMETANLFMGLGSGSPPILPNHSMA